MFDFDKVIKRLELISKIYILSSVILSSIIIFNPLIIIILIDMLCVILSFIFLIGTYFMEALRSIKYETGDEME